MPGGLTKFFHHSTSLPLKNKCRMLYFRMDFAELKIDGPLESSALSSAIAEADLRTTRLLAPHTILNEGLPPEFQNGVANRQLDHLLQQQNCHSNMMALLSEKLMVKTNFTSPSTGLLFLQRNNTEHDLCEGIRKFSIFSLQV